MNLIRAILALALIFAAQAAHAQMSRPSSLMGGTSTDQLLHLVQNYSCSPRKTCSKTIRSCEEARWLLRNCPWGGRLDRDGDGVPCENLCGGGRRKRR